MYLHTGRLAKAKEIRYQVNRLCLLQEVSKNGENHIQPHYQYMTESVAQLLGDFTQPRDLVESLTYR